MPTPTPPRPAGHARLALAAAALLPVAYASFRLHLAGQPGAALLLLAAGAAAIVACTHPSGRPWRYLLPGLLGFALFVVLPIVYTTGMSFTRYRSTHLLPLERVRAELERETLRTAPDEFPFRLLRADGAGPAGPFRIEIARPRNAGIWLSQPFRLEPRRHPGPHAPPYPPVPLEPADTPSGLPALAPEEIARSGLFKPLRAVRLATPDGQTLHPDGLRTFSQRTPAWKPNPDGSLTHAADGRTIRPDPARGYFTDDRGEPAGFGFRGFNGLENYRAVFADPRIQGPFFRIFLWTVAFSLLSVAATFAVGILLAVLLDWKALAGRHIYRTLLVLPYAVPAVLSILVFQGLFNQEFGAVNTALKGIFGFAPQWNTDPWSARAMVLLANIWLGYPYMMLLCSGILQSIPDSIYEASAIDGSGPARDFFHLTLPLVLPPLFPLLVSAFAFNFNNFNLVFLLTAGAPRMVGGGIAGETDLLVTYTFGLAFRDSGSNFGLAAAIATILFAIVGALSYVNLRLAKNKI